MKRGGKEKIGEINRSPVFHPPVHVDAFFHSHGTIDRPLNLVSYFLCFDHVKVLLMVHALH